MNYIINNQNQKINLFSLQGKQLLKNYVKTYLELSGGSKQEKTTEKPTEKTIISSPNTLQCDAARQDSSDYSDYSSSNSDSEDQYFFRNNLITENPNPTMEELERLVTLADTNMFDKKYEMNADMKFTSTPTKMYLLIRLSRVQIIFEGKKYNTLDIVQVMSPKQREGMLSRLIKKLKVILNDRQLILKIESVSTPEMLAFVKKYNFKKEDLKDTNDYTNYILVPEDCTGKVCKYVIDP